MKYGVGFEAHKDGHFPKVAIFANTEMVCPLSPKNYGTMGVPGGFRKGGVSVSVQTNNSHSFRFHNIFAPILISYDILALIR